MSRKTRKLIWSVPLVAVFAVVGALAVFGALGLGSVSAQDAEMDYAAGSPLNVTVETGAGEAKRTSLIVKWDAPTAGSDLPITGYRVDQSGDGQRWTHLADVSATSTSYTQMGLKPATLKYYRVFALNRAGIGRVSEAKSLTTVGITEPGEVMNFTVTATGSTTIKLDWDPPTDTGGARIIGYLIHFGTTSADIPIRGKRDADGSRDMIVPILAPTTEYTHKGLAGSTTRHYKVYAVNWYDADMTSKQTLDPIDVRSATTHPVGQPASPTGVTAVPLIERNTETDALLPNIIPPNNLDNDATNDDPDGTNERAEDVDVYWYWPAHNGGATITNFRVEVTKTNAWPDASADAGTPEEAITALAGTEDDAAVDNAVITVTAAVAFQEANAEIPYQLRHAGAGRFLIDPGSKLTYRVFAENHADPQELSLARRSLASTDAAQAMATYAMTQTALLAPEPPTPVSWVNAGVEGESGARGETHHHDSVNLSWEKPDDPIVVPTAYRVDVAEGDAQPLKWRPLEPDTRHSDPTYDHRNWRPKDAAPNPQTFQYRVFGKNGTTIGESSVIDDNIVDAQTAPSPVQNIKSTTVSASQIDLVWQKPTNDGGTDIAKYCVLATTRSIGSQSLPGTECTRPTPTAGVMRHFVEAPRVGVLSESAPETMFMDKGLLADTTYRYKVYAMNDAVDGTLSPVLTEGEEFSTSAEERTEDTKEAVKAGAPLNLTAESAKDANFNVRSQLGVLLLWTGPEHPAGAKITGYSIERSMDGGTTWESLESHRSGDNTHFEDRRNPREDDVLHYRVAAINSEGTGPWSAMVRFPQHDEPHGDRTPPSTVLTAPSNVVAGATDDNDPGAIKLTWDAGDNATTYTVAGVLRNADDTFDTSAAIWMPGVSSPFTLEMGTRPAGTYIIGIAAGKPDATKPGGMDWSNWARVTVEYPQ